jgi:RNA:NAD 2'-phosphotransferase (TPT1/KptA family)
LTRWSKRLSFVLRHHAVELGLGMRPDGFTPLADLLALDHFVECTEDDIRSVVGPITGPKGVAGMSQGPADGKCIRSIHLML